jgi:RNA polymerase sigma factor (sigma-70 family)
VVAVLTEPAPAADRELHSEGARDKGLRAALPSRPPAAEPLARAYTQHVGYVRACLRRGGVARDALDDAVHDVFAVVVRRIADYRPDASMRQWLAGISRHVAWAHRRRARRDAVQPVRESADRPALELRLDLVRSLAALDEAQRAALLRADADGLSAQEIAAERGVPLTTAQWWIRSARARLRATLQRASAFVWLDARRWASPAALHVGATTALAVVLVGIGHPPTDAPRLGPTTAIETTTSTVVPASAPIERDATAIVPSPPRASVAASRSPYGIVRTGEPSVAHADEEPVARTRTMRAPRRRPRPVAADGPLRPAVLVDFAMEDHRVEGRLQRP